MDFDDIQRMSMPELRAFLDQLLAQHAEREQAAQARRPLDEAAHQQQMEHLRALEANQKALNTRLGAMLEISPPIDADTRRAFLSIALLCKRALAAPPHSTLHQMYVLDIARICKRWLNPPEHLTH